MSTDRTTLQDQVERISEEIALEEMFARDMRGRIRTKRVELRGAVDDELIGMRFDYRAACITIRRKARELRDIVQNMAVVA